MISIIERSDKMYEYIKGIYIGFSKDYLVLENNDIGYKIYTSGNTIANIKANGEKIKLFTKQIVREDFIGLYGFLTDEELELFDILLSVNGVGPKAALSILSLSSPQGIKKIIVNEDVKILVKAQGIGAKTAKRILLELKDKFNIENDNNDIEGFEDVEREIIEALMSLGYSESESKKASKNVDKNVRIEDAIKASLKYLMK